MSGLRPGAVAPDGTVASLKSGTATVLLGASRGDGLPTKELVSVESVVLAREAGSVMVAVGLQMLEIVAVPNGVVIGSVGTKGGKPVDADGSTEDEDEDIEPPLVGTALAAAALPGPMIPLVGHVRIWPSDVPGSGLNMPRKS